MAIIDPVKGIPSADPDTAPAPVADPPAERPPAARRRSAWSALRPLTLRMHFYAGLLIAPVLLLAAVTGTLYALSYPAEKLLYRHELTVPAGDSTRPLSAQVAAARAAHPDGTVTAVWPAPQEGATTRVLMASPEVTTEDRDLTVFVDPYTATVRGSLETSGDALPLRAWLSTFHSNLHLGEPGRIYSELAASWMWVVALGGLALWIGRRRTARRARLLLLPERGAAGRRRTLSWHGSVGLWSAAGLVVLSATGLTWSTYAGENIGEVQDRLGGATPAVAAALPGATGGAGGEHAGHHMSPDMPMDMPMPKTADVGIDEVVESARAAGVDTQVQITLPAEGKGYVVKERDRQFPTHLDSVAVDPADGKVMDTLRFADYPVLAKLTRWGIDIHMGVLFGLVNQLALAALGLALVFLTVWGYRMWWLRRPTRDEGPSFGPAYAPGAWRRVPLPLLLPLAAVTGLVGWFVPLLGISLVAFLVLDVVTGRVLKARTA
ncbi:PepSY domain-containing protein [Streptomyces sp. NRRL S-87]|uniref:PepSY-associated TM helix domain-containing protein n=1 Tax=Streptomyces sp. NRRL S-87 TaxID=1463920 RepID=UPI0004C05EE7|nr:PepSY-associated TM helix domain-containing protein [Streptomyces sp. NRRL S-87]